MKYPKINTIWKRDKSGKIIEGDYSKDEFKAISYWSITEKIDGTNIRVIWNEGESRVHFKGRTDRAQIPKPLLEHLEKTFTIEKMEGYFMTKAHKVILFGEGYGNNIQSVGKKYRKDNSFILFDVWIDGWWLEFNNVMQIADEIGIECVPLIGIMDSLGAMMYVQRKSKSFISKEELTAEGIVATSHPLMLFRDGTPIKWKIKVKDYK